MPLSENKQITMAVVQLQQLSVVLTTSGIALSEMRNLMPDHLHGIIHIIDRLPRHTITSDQCNRLNDLAARICQQ